MELFLSWSGDRSKMMAQALWDWMPLVLDDTKPWFSGKDIPAGERWNSEVGTRLERTNFGILCLTRENLLAPWLLFEAGALSKAVDEGAVCPYLLDVDVSEIAGPLSQFQAKKADKSSTAEMIQDINEKLAAPIDRARLSKRFDALWPDLQKALEKIPGSLEEDRAPARSESEILEELVERTRTMDLRFRNLEYEMRRLRRFASGSLSSPLRGRRVVSGPSREDPPTIRVHVDMDTPEHARGSVIDLTLDSRDENFVFTVSSALGLDPAGYLYDWFLLNPEKNHSVLSAKETQNIYEYFGDSPPILSVSEAPF